MGEIGGHGEKLLACMHAYMDSQTQRTYVSEQCSNALANSSNCAMQAPNQAEAFCRNAKKYFKKKTEESAPTAKAKAKAKAAAEPKAKPAAAKPK